MYFHIEKINQNYPFREFVPKVIAQFREQSQEDWKKKYGDAIVGFETLVEPPRTGECYLRDGWIYLGRTKGYTCKRVGGIGTDSWTGKRVWNTKELFPKLVFAKRDTVLHSI